VARIVMAVAVANLGVALILTPELGLEGPALATAIPFFVAFPAMLRVGLSASGAGLGDLARRAWLPAYTLGAGLAGALVAVRLAADPQTLPAVLGAAAVGALAYWLAFWAWVLDPEEHALVRGLLRRSG
jgi:O-antigen/teichoic acid export membrane protein